MPTAMEYLQEAYRQAMETAAKRKQAAYDEANYFVNEADFKAWQEHQLAQARKCEQRALGLAELMGWKS